MITYPVGISPTGCSPYSSCRLIYVDTNVPIMTAISSIGMGMTDRFLTRGCQHMCHMNDRSNLIIYSLIQIFPAEISILISSESEFSSTRTNMKIFSVMIKLLIISKFMIDVIQFDILKSWFYIQCGGMWCFNFECLLWMCFYDILNSVVCSVHEICL